MRRLCLLLLFGLCACLPAPHDVVGTRCAQTSDCGAANLSCVNLVCSPTPSPEDGGDGSRFLLVEDFESGASGWQGITANSNYAIVDARAHSPTHSAWLQPSGAATSDPLGVDYSLAKPFDLEHAYCASAWVDTNTLTTYVNLTFRVLAGTAVQFNAGTVAVPLDGGVFQHVLSGPLRLDGGMNEAHVRVVTNNYKAGASFYVDDVKVWLTDAGCDAEPSP